MTRSSELSANSQLTNVSVETVFRVLVCAGALVCATCGPMTVHYQAKEATPPAFSNCFNAVCPGDAKPLVLGGNDYSPPTLENISRWQKAGYFAGEAYDVIQQTYRQKGYLWTEDGLPCNCLCLGTPHAAIGGKCLDPPVPGTREYEVVLFGE